jgi:HEAT repeat protein
MWGTALTQGQAGGSVVQDNPSIEDLIAKLWDGDQEVRKQAIERLAQIGAPVVPALMKALQKDDRNYESGVSENPSLRKAVIQVGEPAFQALLVGLQPGSDMVRAAAKTLALWGDSRAVEPLIEAMHNQEVSLGGRLYVIDALGTFRDPRAFEPLIAALLDAHRFIRSHAALALAEYGDPSVIPLITEALGDQSQSERRLREGLPRVLTLLSKRQREKALAKTPPQEKT